MTLLTQQLNRGGAHVDSKDSAALREDGVEAQMWRGQGARGRHMMGSNVSAEKNKV
jgi:hypothetical protein